MLGDDVVPLCRVQSNLSLLSCTKPHIDLSKLQEDGPTKAKNKLKLKKIRKRVKRQQSNIKLPSNFEFSASWGHSMLHVFLD